MILHELENRWPKVVIHYVELGVTEQIKLLLDGRLDVGFGRAASVPPAIKSTVCRLDPLCVLAPESHTLAALPRVPLVALAGEPLVLGSERRAAGFNQFLIELCRSAGFMPRVYPGSVDTVRAAADLVAQGRCLACVPASGLATCLPGVVQKPVEPEAHYPWSLLWRSNNKSQQVSTVLSIAHELSLTLGWRDETPESETAAADCST